MICRYGGTSTGLARLEPVAEIAARRALHQRLGARESDFAAAGVGNVDIGLADQERAEVGLAERLEKFGETAAPDVEFQRLLVAAVHVERHLALGDAGERGV